MVSTELTSWLDHRRASATKQRRPGTLDELAGGWPSILDGLGRVVAARVAG